MVLVAVELEVMLVLLVLFSFCLCVWVVVVFTFNCPRYVPRLRPVDCVWMCVDVCGSVLMVVLLSLLAVVLVVVVLVLLVMCCGSGDGGGVVLVLVVVVVWVVLLFSCSPELAARCPTPSTSWLCVRVVLNVLLCWCYWCCADYVDVGGVCCYRVGTCCCSCPTWMNSETCYVHNQLTNMCCGLSTIWWTLEKVANATPLPPSCCCRCFGQVRVSPPNQRWGDLPNPNPDRQDNSLKYDRY